MPALGRRRDRGHCAPSGPRPRHQPAALAALQTTKPAIVSETVEHGPSPSALLAAVPPAKGVTGRYFDDNTGAKTTMPSIRRAVAPNALDPPVAGRLQQISIDIQPADVVAMSTLAPARRVIGETAHWHSPAGHAATASASGRIDCVPGARRSFNMQLGAPLTGDCASSPQCRSRSLGYALSIDPRTTASLRWLVCPADLLDPPQVSQEPTEDTPFAG